VTRKQTKLFTVDDETQEVWYHDEIVPIICITSGTTEVIIADIESNQMFKLMFDQNLDHEPEANGCDMKVLIRQPFGPITWLGNDGDEPFEYRD
jgi:hypothetical protein